MNPYLIITGLCCSIIVSGLIPLFISPKVLVEKKFEADEQKWSDRSPLQRRWKEEAQLKEIEEMKEKIIKEKESNTEQKSKTLQESKTEQKSKTLQESYTGQKRKTRKRKSKGKRKKTRKTRKKGKTKNKSKRK